MGISPLENNWESPGQTSAACLQGMHNPEPWLHPKAWWHHVHGPKKSQTPHRSLSPAETKAGSRQG